MTLGILCNCSLHISSIVIRISLTILLLLGGTVDPIVLVCRPDHLKLVEKYLELPGIGDKGVDVWSTVTRPVLDQICDDKMG